MVTVLALDGLTKKHVGHYALLKTFSLISPSRRVVDLRGSVGHVSHYCNQKYSKFQLIRNIIFVGSTEALLRVFLLLFLFSDWLMLNHLKSRIECGFLDIFSRHICCTVKKTIRVTNYATSFGVKNVQKTKFEAAEMIVDPWNQQI